jgi:hypothetical protein
MRFVILALQAFAGHLLPSFSILNQTVYECSTSLSRVAESICCLVFSKSVYVFQQEIPFDQKNTSTSKIDDDSHTKNSLNHDNSNFYFVAASASARRCVQYYLIIIIKAQRPLWRRC